MQSFHHVLVTGGAGFLGSHLVDLLLADPTTRVTVVDRLSMGGSRMNLAEHEGDERFRFVWGDVAEPGIVAGVLGDGVDAVIHAAAETHVDRSIDDPRAFFESNVIGTQAVLEAVRRTGIRLLMISTDEDRKSTRLNSSH